jgi:glycosyltransferase involved in cell wall biosynthesis
LAYHLSVIIPHFNSPILLAKLLDSIPEKEDIQIIVVDDNSTKQLPEYQSVTEKYAHRVEFYRNDSGVQSAGACRNIGLRSAKGTWVIFADADDYFLPGMYETVSRYFSSDNDMVIFCPTSVFLDTGETADRHLIHEKRIHRYLSEPTHENLMNVKRMKGPWSKIIRRSVIEERKLRFSETLHHNDMYFVFMAGFYCEKTAVSGDVIYCITRNRGSLTTKITERAFDQHVQEYIKCYCFGAEHYSREDFALCGLNGGSLLFEACKRRLGMKKILQTGRLLRKNHLPLLSKQMKNPRYLLNAVIQNNKVINKEKRYYEGESHGYHRDH